MPNGCLGRSQGPFRLIPRFAIMAHDAGQSMHILQRVTEVQTLRAVPELDSEAAGIGQLAGRCSWNRGRPGPGGRWLLSSPRASFHGFETLLCGRRTMRACSLAVMVCCKW